MDGAFPKDFNLISCILTLADQSTQVDLRWVVVEINTYESLWSSNVSASLLLRDTNNMISNLPIYGYETLLLEFQTPDSTIWSKSLRLIRIADRALEKDHSEMYHLHFVTEEMVDALQTRISKSYPGKLLSDIVSDVWENWIESESPINIEETSGLYHVILPNWTAFQAINWCSTRANSAGFPKGASYLFYEDRDQFNFCTLESLYNEKPSFSSIAPEDVYLYQPANVRQDNPLKTRDVALDMRSVQSYKFNSHSDILTNISTGMYGNTVITHDSVLKKWERYEWDYPSTFNEMKHLTPNLLYSGRFPDLASPEAKLKVHSTGGPEHYWNPQLWLQPRVSQLQQAHNISIQAIVPGNTERTVGNIVGFLMPSAESLMNNQLIYDKFYQGSWMISAVRHKIDMATFVTSMDLFQDSVHTQYP